MRIFPEKYRLPAGLGIMLALGFLLVGAAGYIAARDAARLRISQQLLPLAADQVQAELRAALARPILASSALAQEPALRDALVAGDSGADQIARSLKESQQKSGAADSFVVSDRTRMIYRAEGGAKPILEIDNRDKWFFTLRDAKAGKADYQVNVERDGSAATVHHRIRDQNGEFIGATGVSVKLDDAARLLERVQTRLQGSVYLVDVAGMIVLSGKPAPQQRALAERAGMRDIAAALLSQSADPAKVAQLEYESGGATVLVQARQLPELGLRLIAERGLYADLAGLLPALWLALGIAAATILLALGLVTAANRRYRRQLEDLAATDTLTGTMNRQGFEVILRQSMLDFERTGRPLSIILFDIDNFKQINGSLGHQSGDEVLREVAVLARRAVRENDIVTRWGSEEFLILLRDCELEFAARQAEKLRSLVAGHDFMLPEGARITVSVGVAQYLLQEAEARFFERANQARYEAKATGRNRTIISVMEGQDAQQPTPQPTAARRA